MTTRQPRPPHSTLRRSLSSPPSAAAAKRLAQIGSSPISRSISTTASAFQKHGGEVSHELHQVASLQTVARWKRWYQRMEQNQVSQFVPVAMSVEIKHCSDLCFD